MAVESLEIRGRESIANGASFGDAGPYERLVGTVRFAADPHDAGNANITDLHLAPCGDDGRIHFSADFAVLRPVEQHRGNGRLVFDVVNRGSDTALRFLHDDVAGPNPTSAGHAFLMREGYTVARCGWQHDLPDSTALLRISIPEAVKEGAALTGPVMCDFQPDERTHVMRLPAGGPAVVATDTLGATAQLTVRDDVNAPRSTIPTDEWQFARLEDGRTVPDRGAIHLTAGFEPGKIYELVYTAQGAPLVGLGLLAVRDVVTWLRYGDAASGNPCAGSLGAVYGFGVSQSGHFLRHFLYLGLNEDERERAVFDGVLIVIAGARRGEFNLRFGQPAKTLGEYMGALFPFSDVVQTDAVTGQSDGLLARLTARGKVPKVITFDSSAEYWSRQASLVHTTLDGFTDLTLPASSRYYLMAGTHHGRGALAPTDRWLQSRSWHALNSVDFAPLLRAGLVNLDRWISTGEEPPPSRYPRLDDGTAITPEHASAFFAAMPGVHVLRHIPVLPRLDFGPRAGEGVVDTLPPLRGPAYPHFVSAIDEDGNEIAGVRLPDVAVPLATFTGWNVRHPDVGAAGEVILRAGSTFPFACTEAQRHESGDQRKSIAGRYASKEEYLRQVREAAVALTEARYLLLEDVDPLVAHAARRWDLYAVALDHRAEEAASY